MTREKAIQVIEDHYPPDDDRPEAAAIGRALLEEAKARYRTWRNESEDVLCEFARLTLAKEHADFAASERRRKDGRQQHGTTNKRRTQWQTSSDSGNYAG